jgi:hypothetical protein
VVLKLLTKTFMNIVKQAYLYKPSLDKDTISRLEKLSIWDFSTLVEDMGPRLLLEEGRLFSIEQLIPILLHFAQSDPAVKDIARSAILPWLSDVPYIQQKSNLSEEFVSQACDRMKHIVDILAEEFRRFVAISLVEPDQVHAPSGPVDMFWHFLILHTVQYNKFCEEVWGSHAFDKHLEV